MRLTILNVAGPGSVVGEDACYGAEQVLTQIDEALVRAGHTSVVIASGGSVRGTLLPTGSVSGSLSNNSRRSAWEKHLHAVLYAVQNWPIDVVHMHGVDFRAYLPPAGTPVLVTLHFPVLWYPASVFEGGRPGTFLQCVSEAERRSCSAMANGAMLPVIQNGVPIRQLTARHAKRAYVIMAGDICPEKGVHLALDAAELAGVPLLIAGETNARRTNASYFDKEIAPRLKCGNRFLGPINFRRRRRLMSGAKCLLLPNLEPEMSSVVAMEALACGTPVVAFGSGALSEIVEDGRTGYLVRDAGEMASAICALNEINPEHCRQAARRRFSADRMTGEYLALYERLAIATAPAMARRSFDLDRAA